jgi:predicted hotdog family 3-hydroxylacyl-ACP dehydratase
LLKLPLDRMTIAQLVPHHGSMCLLDRVLSWDSHHIQCETEHHTIATNPLRREGFLPAICGVEFALQAMALHGALSAEGTPQRAGFVSSLREIEMKVERLDDIAVSLLVMAEAVVAEANGFIYRFAISAYGRDLLSGQAAVILPPATT